MLRLASGPSANNELLRIGCWGEILVHAVVIEASGDSFDLLVGASEERRWHSNAMRLGGFHIHDQLETSWLLDRQIGGVGAFEDFVDVHGSLAKKVRIYRGVRHQPALVDEPARHGNRWHAVFQRQLRRALAPQAGPH